MAKIFNCSKCGLPMEVMDEDPEVVSVSHASRVWCQVYGLRKELEELKIERDNLITNHRDEIEELRKTIKGINNG